MVVMPLDALVDPSIQRLTAVSYKRYPLSSKIRLSLNFPKAKNGFDKTILSLAITNTQASVIRIYQ